MGPEVNKLSFAQVNSQRSAQVSAELVQFYLENHIDILLLQEPYHAFGAVRSLSCRSILIVPAVPNPMVAAVVSGELSPVVLAQYCTSHFLVFTVSCPVGELFIINVYCQYAHPVDVYLHVLADLVEAFRGRRLVVAIDSNAKSPMWFARGRDDRGVLVEDFILASGLVVCNIAGEPSTFSTDNGESNIDLTLVSASVADLLAGWRVDPDVCTSDHRCILFDVVFSVDVGVFRLRGLPRVPDFDLARADWEMFRACLVSLENRISDLASVGDAEDVAAGLQNGLVDLVSVCFPEKKKMRNRGHTWWSHELSEMRTRVALLRRDYQRARRGNALDGVVELAACRYRRARNSYVAEIRRAKLSDWRECVRGRGNSDPWGVVYRVVCDKLRVGRAMSSLRVGGAFTETYNDSVRVLFDTLLPARDPGPLGRDHQGVVEENRRYTSDCDVSLFSVDDILSLSSRLRSGRAPGPDGITNEIMTEVVGVCPEMLLLVFNVCLRSACFPRIWKCGMVRFLLKSPNRPLEDPGSYRPICLLPVLGKLFERLIVAKLRGWKSESAMFSHMQYGFVSGLGTADALMEVIRNVRESPNKYVAAIMFDVKGAFDGLWWPSVLRRLRSLGCPGNLYWLIASYLGDRSVVHPAPRGMMRHEMGRGCPQGSVLGPVLWNLVYSDVLVLVSQCEGSRVVAYADDLIVLVVGDSRRELELRLNCVVRTCVGAVEDLRLTLSVEKTVAVLLRGKLDRDRYPSVRLYGSLVSWNRENRYLGVVLDEGLSFLPHIKAQREKLASVCGKLMRVARGRSRLNFATMSILYRGLCVPVFTYGANAFYLRAGNVHFRRVLFSIQRLFLLMQTGACRTVSTEALQVLAGALPADLQVVATALFLDIGGGRGVNYGEVVFDNLPEGMDPEEVRHAVRDRKAAVRLHVRGMWQERWNASADGRMLFRWLPRVDFVECNAWFRPSYEVSCFLTGYGFFRESLFGRGLCEVPDCRCGERQSAVHLLVDCVAVLPLFREAMGGFRPRDVGWYLLNAGTFACLSEICKRIFEIKNTLI